MKRLYAGKQLTEEAQFDIWKDILNMILKRIFGDMYMSTLKPWGF